MGLPALGGGTIEPSSLVGRAVLVVNVASRCGLTPQYEGLERLQRLYGGPRFTVLGVPCNQFAGQEPGTSEEIQEFCSLTYGTTFPMTAKMDVNGPKSHVLFRQLTATADGYGHAGDVEWNFEKFLVARTGEVLARFRPPVPPEHPQIVTRIEAALR
jgi:glutathione peroxidase